MDGYTEKVLDHFQHPRNAGILEDASGIGEFGDPGCGDYLKVFLKVEDHTITEVKYQIRGCPASIACASAMTELAMGKNLDDAMMIVDEDILEALDGLPESKLHCSNLGAMALKKAIINYFDNPERKEGAR
jgi:nitrogen fixation protein NifU and related proteins